MEKLRKVLRDELDYRSRVLRDTDLSMDVSHTYIRIESASGYIRKLDVIIKRISEVGDYAYYVGTLYNHPTITFYKP